MTPLETLASLRKGYPTPMSNQQLGQLLNAVAWAHRADGFGLLAKPTGSNCKQPQTGTLIARDILASKKGIHYDVLIDAEGSAKPVWQDKGSYAATRFVEAVLISETTVDVAEPLTQPLVPPPVVIPPVTPPVPQHVVQPYPDESTWWAEVFDDIAGLYTQADRAQDLTMARWAARMAYDIGAGMPKAESKTKHLAELRAMLGL